MKIEQYGPSEDVATVIPSQRETQTLLSAANDLWPTLRDADHAAAYDVMAETGESLRDELPEIVETLGAFTLHTAQKALIFKGPEPDHAEIGPTPLDYLKPHENPLLRVGVYRGLLLGAMRLHAYGYDSQQPGNIHNNVVPIERFAGVKGASANSKSALGLHTEDASYNLAGALLPNGKRLDDSFGINPSILSLQFLRNPHLVPTTLSVPDINRLSPASRTALEQPYFRNSTNPTQQENGRDNNSNLPLGILYGGSEAQPWLRANLDGLIVVEGAPAEAHQALNDLATLAVNSVVNLPSLPGDIIFIDNRRTLHGRAPFAPGQEPKFDGRDRHQQRVVAIDDPNTLEPYLAQPRIVSIGKFMDHVAQEALKTA